MSVRCARIVFAVGVLAGCNGQELHVGSNGSGTVARDAGTSPTPGSDDGGMSASDGSAPGAASGAADASPLSPTIGIRTCEGELPDASATSGMGFTAIPPLECGGTPGPAHPVASAADVMNLLAGTWSACAGLVFGMPIDSASGVELTSDGQYHLMGASPDDSLVSLDSLGDSGGGIDAGGAGPATDGTYQVVDGSATYGPGTYELQLRPAGGGLFLGQAVVTDSPRQLQYLEPNAGPQTFSPAAPWSPVAGACSCPPAVGFAAIAPLECGETPGPAHPVASASDVTSLLPGTWSACAGQVFGLPVDSVIGVELTSGGQYRLLGTGPNTSLVPFYSPVDSDAGDEAGAGPGSTLDGTYEVVDGSASYGPGTYELQLSPASGGLFRGQVVVTDSPRQLQYLAPNASAQTLSSSYPWAVRAGVCSCLDAKGTKVSEQDPVGLAAAMTGRWLWCGSEPVFPPVIPPPPSFPPSFWPGAALGPVLGIEFSNDGTWHALGVDATGAITRGTGTADEGTFQIVSSNSPPGLDPAIRLDWLGSEPLSVELQMTNGTDYAQVIVTQSPRALLLTAFPTYSPYSIFFPIP